MDLKLKEIIEGLDNTSGQEFFNRIVLNFSSVVNVEYVFIAKLNYDKLIENKDIALISIVGAGMKTHTGVATKMFDTLSKSKINISMISTSEIKISCVIDQSKCKKAIKSLHKEFKLG